MEDLGSIIRECFRNPDDHDALNRFNTAFRPYLLAVLVSMYRREPSLAEDAYQSAFIKFIKTFRAGARPEMNYEAYFVAIAKNCLIDELRKYQRHLPFDEVIESEIDRTGYDQARQTEARIQYLEAMMLLGARCRFVLERHLIQGMTPAQIAQCLGVRPQSVYVIIKRCRDQLRNILK